MNDDRAVEVSETKPPTQGMPWAEHGESLSPEFVAPPAEPQPPPAAPREPRRRRWRFVPRSLSSRLVVFVVGLVVFVVAATGATTYLALQSFLFNRLDQQVNTLASQNGGDVARSVLQCLQAQQRTCPVGTSSSPVHAPQQQWLEVLGPDELSSSFKLVLPPDVKHMNLSTAQINEIVAQPDQDHTWTVDGQSLRLTARQVDQLIVVTGLSTGDVTHTLHRLIWLEVAIGAFAIAVALGLTTWGVHLSLRPLNRVTRTAREVTAELSPDGAALDRRVPEGDPETEVGQLADSFNSLMGTVEAQFAARVQSEERMRQFLADASHELRTPLTSIRGYAELSRMRRADGEPDHADTMDRIESEGTRMSRLVDDLLLLARGDQGHEPQRELVDVDELVDVAVAGARAAYPQRRIDVAVAPGLQVIGDPDQLLRALRNPITNAAVHTEPNGPIRVTAYPEGSDVVVRVVDAGPGLPPEQAQHVFERFWRADKARSRAHGGSGLGLSIVASIANAHDGTVDFESTVAGGSTVTLRLPSAGPDEGEDVQAR
jgi:two-component system, OmpR family, sensor kinase